jgi:hypothetical protein
MKRSRYSSKAGSLLYQPSVGLEGQDQFRSSRQVNFNGVVCDIMRSRGHIASSIVSPMNLRDQLKIQFSPPIPRDNFSKVMQPLQTTITTVPNVGKGAKFSHQVQVTVRDAQGTPVAGLPVAFIPSSGTIAGATAIVTDNKGMAQMGLQVTKEGRARVVAVVDETPLALTARIGPARI